MKQKFKLILASSSPRRIDFLKRCGLRFKVIHPRVDEKMTLSESPQQMVRRLSREKAYAVALQYSSKSGVILAADTCVVDPGGQRVLGKPKSWHEAERMLRILQGQTHTVFTAYTILWREGARLRSHTRMVKTRVKIRPMKLKEILAYVRSGEPMDKAGSYAAQGLGTALVQSVRGSYSSVVGLPMAELISDLQKFFKLEFP